MIAIIDNSNSNDFEQAFDGKAKKITSISELKDSTACLVLIGSVEELERIVTVFVGSQYSSIPVFLVFDKAYFEVSEIIKKLHNFDYWLGAPEWSTIINRVGILVARTEHLESDSYREDISNRIMIDKLVTLGEMTAGVMHEINRPLTLINGNVDRLKKHISGKKTLEQEKLQKAVEKAEMGVERAVKLVKSLISFVRNTAKDSYDRVILSELFDDVEILCGAKLYSSHIPLSFPEQDSLAVKEIEARSSEIAQVLINLISNACDAQVENKISDPFIRVELEGHGSNVVIRVIDAGQGIDSEHLPKIFQTLYTTKEVGKGTGLGLSLSRRIAEEHSGTLSVDETHKNTCFVLTLPLKQR